MSEEFYLLRCDNCDLNMPFPSNEMRADWMAGHLTTGHETYLLWCVARNGGSDE